MSQQNKMREVAETIVNRHRGKVGWTRQTSIEDVHAFLQSLRDETIEECAAIARRAVADHDEWLLRHGRGWVLEDEQQFIETAIRSLKTPKPEESK